MKIVEKNIYWVITCEIHRRIHKTKVDYEEYCHCIKDQKEKYILESEHNFKYDNIDSIIYKLKCSNKKIEFIAIKSIYISKNYLGLMSWLIDRAFCITPSIKQNKTTIKNSTNKNKSLLIKILYDINPQNLLKCFSKNCKK